MKKLILLFLLCTAISKLNAQVKIGAPGNPDVNAVLELAGSTKGLLLPRLALNGTTNAAPLSAHSAGMVIYNTAAVADVTPGYYYNDGVKWNRLTNASETWAMKGNAATNPANQFLGTTDSIDFTIRTNNLERIRISSSGNFNIGTNFFPNNVRIRIGGSSSGPLAAIVGIGGTVSATEDGQTLYSLRNTPLFGTTVRAGHVMATSNELSYSGEATGYIIADNASINTNGTNSYGAVVGIRGSILRLSSGTSDNAFIGAEFSAETNESGNVNSLVGISGNVSVYGDKAISINSFGSQSNFVTISNANATLPQVFGTQNVIQLLSPTTSNQIIGTQTHINASSNGIFLSAYGTNTSFNAFSGGRINNAYGHYLNQLFASNNITNYTGIYVGDIGLASGARRAFEYAGAGPNDPVVVNYDGSVQIGTYATVPNAKLSIVDGHLQSGQTTKPTITSFANMGTGGIATLNDATDIAGIIDLDLGSGAWSSGPQATIIFNKVYANSPIVIICPANSAAAAGVELQRVHVTTNATSFTISFGAAATNGNSMRFNYHVIETVNN